VPLRDVPFLFCPLTATMTFSITCWIFDEDPQTVFDVEIHDEDKDIKFLKTEIKRVSASRLGDVFPSDLELWQVDIPSEELREWLPENPPLKAFQKLGIFKNGGQDHVHVIINNPGMSQSSLF
jgi:Crinkler effector protein N-terminal domain